MRLTHGRKRFTSRRAVLALSVTQARVVNRNRVHRLMRLNDDLVASKKPRCVEPRAGLARADGLPPYFPYFKSRIRIAIGHCTLSVRILIV